MSCVDCRGDDRCCCCVCPFFAQYFPEWTPEGTWLGLSIKGLIAFLLAGFALGFTEISHQLSGAGNVRWYDGMLCYIAYVISLCVIFLNKTKTK